MTVDTIKFYGPNSRTTLHEEPTSNLTLLGKGVYGNVYKKSISENPPQNTQFTIVALKVVNLEPASLRRIVEREIDVLRKIKKVTNVVTFYDFYDSGKVITITTNYIPAQTLNEVFVKNKVYPPIRTMLTITKQVAGVLKDLDVLRIIHGDISVNNIMYDGKTVTLVDFGIAVNLESFNSNDHILSCPVYRAPEIPLEVLVRDNSPDVFSLAAVMYYTYTKQLLLLPGADDTLADHNNLLLGITAIKGPAPLTFLSRGKNFSRFFDPKGTFLNDTPSKSCFHARKLELIKDVSDSHTHDAQEDVNFFTELVSSMFTWEPHDRPTPKNLVNRITVFEQSITQKN